MAQQTSATLNQEEALSEARRLADELGDKLRGLLFQELQRGGPASAARVCSELAHEITREFNRDTGRNARRVSLRVRNPRNVPDDYERRVLARMDGEILQKRLASEYVDVVTDQKRTVLRYMRPLIVAPVCILCHGPTETMAEEVKRIIAERYPADRATGFREGDLRGAISVKILLKPAPAR
jgi:hypothetical protein